MGINNIHRGPSSYWWLFGYRAQTGGTKGAKLKNTAVKNLTAYAKDQGKFFSRIAGLCWDPETSSSRRAIFQLQIIQ